MHGALCRLIARELGLAEARCELIQTASAMHDIGTVGIPDQILLKPGPLAASDRVYRPRLPRDHALGLLHDGRGSHFDPQVLDAFFDVADRPGAQL